ncbi:MAG: S-layer homology domain-containing protein, partial [Clostridia bacterium]|nr:S-layer homology domain-containing protein [Clostridia bacterium]
VTRQDTENSVLMWDASQGCTYRIYRSDAESGEYELIGESDSGAFVDTAAVYPAVYWYKLQEIAADGSESELSDPVQTGTNAQPVYDVTVIMYHDFITQEDVENGVVFGEYALDPADFEADLQYLRNNGYTLITSDDLVEYLYGNQPLPPKAVIISIDDGTLGVFTNGWPLLKKYNLKADFNVIGEQIDLAWETVYYGGTRDGEEAPYCTWNELKIMVDSGAINLCTHTYGMHHYDRSGRIGLSMLEEESIEEYTQVLHDDYKKIISSMTGWWGIVPRTLAYPYSRRTETTDRVLLEEIGFDILMCGEGVRPTSSNFFVLGGGVDGSIHLMNRPCRMNGSPIEEYLAAAQARDYSNGVNAPVDTLALGQEACKELAQWYNPFTDVATNAWYSGNTYYTYVNALMTGTGASTFSPDAFVSRGMVAVILHRMAGKPAAGEDISFSDVSQGVWYDDAARWAAETEILPGVSETEYAPNADISRAELAVSLYRYAKFAGIDTTAAASLERFVDADLLSDEEYAAMEWAVASGIFQGDDKNCLLPDQVLTRAQFAAVLHGWHLHLQA